MSVRKDSKAANGFVVILFAKSNQPVKTAALATSAKKLEENKHDSAAHNTPKDVFRSNNKGHSSKADRHSNDSSCAQQVDCKPKSDDCQPKQDPCQPKQDSCQPKPDSCQPKPENCKPSFDPCNPKPSCAPKVIIDETAGIQAGTNEITFRPPPLVTLIPSGAALFAVSGVVAGEVSNVATAGAFSSVLSLAKPASSVGLKMKDNDGAANGIYSGLRAINGSKIFFYPVAGSAGSNDFLFVGRVGNGSNPNSSGEVAITLVFGALKNGAGNVTGFNLYTLLFDVPIEHPDTLNPNDGASITSLIDVSGTYARSASSECDDKGGKQQSFCLPSQPVPVCILDDGPKISLDLSSRPLVHLNVDETDLLTNDTKSFTAAFVAGSFSFGTDGPGATSSSYSLSIASGSTGLIDVATGRAVVLSITSGGIVQGRTSGSGSAGGLLVFNLSVASNCDVTLDQVRALKHDDPNDPDDIVSLRNASLIKLTRTDIITDADGDTACAKACLAICKSLHFKDDGPSAIIVITDTNLAQLVVDETNLSSNAIANFSANFSAAGSSFGADGPGTISSGGYQLQTIGGLCGLTDVATDHEVRLSLNGLTIEGRTDDSDQLLVFTVTVNGSGDVTLDQKRAVKHPDPLTQDESVSLSAANLIALANTVTVIDKDGDKATSTESLDIGLLLLFKDDGPKALDDASTSFEIAKAVLDESPLPLTGDGAYTATVDLSGAFTTLTDTDYGTDGPGSFSYELTLTPSSAGADIGTNLYLLDSSAVDGKGAEILLVQEPDGSVTGQAGATKVFSISVDSAGVVTFAYLDGSNPANIWHPLNPDNDDEQSLNTGSSGLLSLGQRVVDADGDWVVTQTGLNLGNGIIFGIQDDGPNALADAGGSFAFPPVFLDESPLEPGGDGVYSITLNLGAAFTNALSIDYGTDGPGSTAFSLKLTPSVVGAPVFSGLYLLDPTDVESIIDPIGQGEQIRLLDIAGTVYGVTGIADTKLFSISVNNLGVVTFEYSDQVDPANIWHSDVSNDDESEFLNTGNSGTLSVIQRAVDADGDWVETANGLVIGAGNAFGIQDDGPTLTVTAGPVVPTPLVVDETFLGIPSTFKFSILVNEISNVGTDKPGFDIVTNYTLSAVSPLQTNLIATAEQTPVFLFLEGGDVVGRAGFGPALPNALGSLIFRLSLDSSTGVASLTQFLAVVHPIPGNPNEPINTQIGDDQITITVTSTISDSDGDVISKSTSFRIGDSLTFIDDAPFVAPSLAFVSLASVVSSLSVDETSLAINTTTDFSGDFASLAILPGNDGLKSQSVSYALAIDSGSNDSGLKDSATGDAVLLSKSLGGEVFGTINSGATVVFKLTVDSAGNVTLDQQRSLVHPDALDPNDPVSLTPLKDGKQLISLVKSITTIDRDDDPLTENISLDLTTALEFRDDGPTAKNDTDALASGSNDPKTGNVITGLGTTSGTAGADLSGADAPGTISAITGAGGTDSSPGDGLSILGSYGSLSIGTDGQYIYTRTPGSTDGVSDIFTYTLSDKDADTSTATLTISIPEGSHFIVGSPDGDASDSTVPWTVDSGGFGVIDGTPGSDILIGDPGGSSLAPGSTANIVFVLDNSGSMSTLIRFGESARISRLRALKNSVIASLQDLYNSGAANVRVHIDKFSQSAAPVGTFTLTKDGTDDAMQLSAAIRAVDSIADTNSTTNYEAGLQSALNWISLTEANGGPLSTATVSQLLFISDGEPNYLLRGNNTDLSNTNTSSASVTDALNSALGLFASPIFPDNISEVDNIESLTGPIPPVVPSVPPHVAFTIEAIGISIGSTELTNLTKIEGNGILHPNPDPGADNITTADQLTTVIADLVDASAASDAAGPDIINGVDSSDLIFGDSLNSDALAIAQGVSGIFLPGSGWDVFAYLEGPDGATKGPGGGQWKRADSIAYISSNTDICGKESGRTGGNDTIDAGSGDDIIYGQEGNDIITGGSGNDTIIAGSGADRITGGTGNDIFRYNPLNSIASQTGLTAVTADIITDFASGSDKLLTGIAGVVGTNLRNDAGAASRDFANSLTAANTFFNASGNQAYNYFYTFDTSAGQSDAYLFFKSGGSSGSAIAGITLDVKPGTLLQNGDII